MSELIVRDHDKVISISFADILKYHGGFYVGGVAHAFKAMERAFPLLSPKEPPDRYGISVVTAFPGLGGRDAFEYVTRGLTMGNRFRFDPSVAPPDAPDASSGRFFVRFGYAGRTVDVVLRSDIVSEEFVRFGRIIGPHLPAAIERFEWLKQDMADRVAALPAEQVYAVYK